MYAIWCGGLPRTHPTSNGANTLRSGWSNVISRTGWRFEVMRKGYVKGEIEPGEQAGEWKVKLAMEMKGRREVGVVVVVVNGSKLRVITVEWEDLR
jgi:hypothetical protein